VLRGSWAVLGVFLAFAPLAAQLRMSGQVLRGDEPLTDATVVLHSVSPDSSGQVDSVRVTSDGRFEFDLPGDLDDEERTQIYFASVRHEGVLYFGQAVAQSAQLDSLYLVLAYDAVPAPAEGVELPLSVRNLILEQSEGGWRATDLFQIRNDGNETFVAAEGGVVWSHPLPPGATDPQLGRGDLSPDAISFEDGVIKVSAPLPPGERLLLVRYLLPTLPATVPIAVPTDVMELLVLEPAPPIEASPLQQMEVVGVEGSSYRRYSATDLQGVDLTIEEVDPPGSFPTGWMAVIFALIMTGVGLYVYYRSPSAPAEVRVASSAGAGSSPPRAAAPDRDRQALILQVARIDEELKALDSDAAGEREHLHQRRVTLMDELRSMS
jgi:hypothetical protein